MTPECETRAGPLSNQSAREHAGGLPAGDIRRRWGELGLVVAIQHDWTIDRAVMLAARHGAA
ncbi:hypothetical protein ACUXAV_003240 [Cupriavidus metallidurans]|uniref:hypothetical protein n=1 Tax=Cupriavidus TaxID=106589 RepID=UPI00055D3D4C|nr:hypothetical protein [Cupriavidus metallidurans]KWW34413.1 hypothetical protein AU374_04641 [Cupriavidus metallidurans]MDE4921147.1 hypothetical protein [Cupriavidus metallidurans]